MVAAGREGRLAVRAEGGRGDGVLVADQTVYECAARHVPDPCLVVRAGGGEQLPVRAERYAHDGRWVVQCPKPPTAGQIPDDGGAVDAACRDESLIRAERHAGGWRI